MGFNSGFKGLNQPTVRRQETFYSAATFRHQMHIAVEEEFSPEAFYTHTLVLHIKTII